MLRATFILSIAFLGALLPATALAHAPRAAVGAATHRETRTARPTPQPARARALRPAARPRSNTNVRHARRPARPCLSPAVEIVRVEGTKRESRHLSLTRCNGTPNTNALTELSILARPHGVERPTASALRDHERRVPVTGRRTRRNVTPADPSFLADDVKRLDAGLLLRLQKVATRFPNRSIEVVSGYRANERASSRHHQARAMDIRVRGISRERLRDFARSLDETGVGYYPNSVFVHMDVRDRSAYWIDRSGPGEEADYGQWPRPQQEITAIRENLIVRLDAALERFREAATNEEAAANDAAALDETEPTDRRTATAETDSE